MTVKESDRKRLIILLIVIIAKELDPASITVTLHPHLGGNATFQLNTGDNKYLSFYLPKISDSLNSIHEPRLRIPQCINLQSKTLCNPEKES